LLILSKAAPSNALKSDSLESGTADSGSFFIFYLKQVFFYGFEAKD
jgi:hypothetical protein